MKRTMTIEHDPASFLPKQLGRLENPQTDLPRIARDPKLTALIEAAVREVPTTHDLYLHDSREMSVLKPESVHLVVTSPPYWTLKEYRRSKGQLGLIADYWKKCRVPRAQLLFRSRIFQCLRSFEKHRMRNGTSCFAKGWCASASMTLHVFCCHRNGEGRA